VLGDASLALVLGDAPMLGDAPRLLGDALVLGDASLLGDALRLLGDASLLGDAALLGDASLSVSTLSAAALLAALSRYSTSSPPLHIRLHVEPAAAPVVAVRGLVGYSASHYPSCAISQ